MTTTLVHVGFSEKDRCHVAVFKCGVFVRHEKLKQARDLSDATTLANKLLTEFNNGRPLVIV